MRLLQCCTALMFLALAALQAVANRDSCTAWPTAWTGGRGQNHQMLAQVHRGSPLGREAAAESFALDSGDLL